MTNSEQKMLKEIITIRQEVALERLTAKPYYFETYEQQNKTGDPEEKENIRVGMEFEAIYIQGLRDSAKILAFLGIINSSND